MSPTLPRGHDGLLCDLDGVVYAGGGAVPGAVETPVPRPDAALEVAEAIAAKDTRVIRAAKEAINNIDPVDVKASYRLEQGYTFELNLAGVADEHRDAFVSTGKPLAANSASDGGRA